jgi:membrane-bound metal-dependent hydrolase YbcI (DUF457 family)
MMGHTHSLSGAAAFLAVSPLLVSHPSPAAVAVGAVCAAGGALLPDMDHHSATPARAFGFPSRLLAWAIGKVSGGHRHATHSILGLAAFTVAAYGATTARGWPLIVLLTLLAGMAVRALGPRPRERRWKLDYADVAGLVHAAAAGWLAYRVVTSGMDLSVVPWAVAMGAAAHIAGDMLTEQGCPLGWPSLRYYRVATINTGSWVERYLVAGALYLILAAIVWRTWSSWSPAITHILAGS